MFEAEFTQEGDKCTFEKVGRFEPGRHIEYERVKNWWGADLPVARGQNNFDIVRYEYYRDVGTASTSAHSSSPADRDGGKARRSVVRTSLNLTAYFECPKAEDGNRRKSAALAA
jgi:hypothetical protein